VAHPVPPATSVQSASPAIQPLGVQPIAVSKKSWRRRLAVIYHRQVITNLHPNLSPVTVVTVAVERPHRRQWVAAKVAVVIYKEENNNFLILLIIDMNFFFISYAHFFSF